MTARAPKRRVERALEATLFASRWLMAPFYLGLVAALAGLLVVFCRDLVTELAHLATMTPDNAILMALSLIDLSLAGNLLLIVAYSGYENFVSRIDVANDDRPDWMGTVDFSGLKMKLIASIVAISAIALLKSFMALDEGPLDPVRLGWMVGIHLTFVVSGVLLALMDHLNDRSH
ncbi:MAG: TIGR00645 family protein [Sphingomonadaceae bacterium]|nr:TIGR00645 family protein [Sphingomonadaceae bacterium]